MFNENTHTHTHTPQHKNKISYWVSNKWYLLFNKTRQYNIKIFNKKYLLKYRKKKSNNRNKTIQLKKIIS